MKIGPALAGGGFGTGMTGFDGGSSGARFRCFFM
jgi:hypothetical protein